MTIHANGQVVNTNNLRIANNHSTTSSQNGQHIDAGTSGLLAKTLVSIPPTPAAPTPVGEPTEKPKKSKKSNAPKDDAGVSTNITWTHYADAAESLGYVFRWNDLLNGVEVNGAPIDDLFDDDLICELHAKGLRNADLARRAVRKRAAEDRYHPVKEYLEELEWDGADHIAALSKYFPDVHEPVSYADDSKRTVFHAFFRRW